MSRGPGRWQRAILDMLERNTAGGVVITHPDHDHAEQNALRRAARRLEEDGRIVLTSQRIGDANRLVAYLPSAEAPASRTVHGMDGKLYRQPV